MSSMMVFAISPLQDPQFDFVSAVFRVHHMFIWVFSGFFGLQKCG